MNTNYLSRFLRPVICFDVLAICLSTAAFSQELSPTFANLPYALVENDDGSPATLHMNLWLPQSNAFRAPVVVWIHGGGWYAGSYEDSPLGLESLLEAGFAVASVEYRLSGAAIFPAQILDVKGAVRYLRANAHMYRLDASRFAAWGDSAGGHLSALLATSGDVAELEGAVGGNLEFSSRIQAAVDYFGPTDILNLNPDVMTPPGSLIDHDDPLSPGSMLIGFSGMDEGIGLLRLNLDNPTAPFPDKAALAISANPITHLSPDDPPIHIAHGDLDQVVSLKQSLRLANAMEESELEYSIRVVAGEGHGFAQQAEIENAETIAFLLSHLDWEAGDFNRDGEIDEADYLVWKRDLGSDTSAADANGNGIVDAADYTIWRDTAIIDPSSAAFGIPEPHCGLLGSAAIVILTGLRNLNRRSSPIDMT